jgi:hypothetical protein
VADLSEPSGAGGLSELLGFPLALSRLTLAGARAGVDALAAVPRAVTALEQLAALAPAVRDLATLAPPLAELAGLAMELRTLVGPGGLARVAPVVEDLHTLTRQAERLTAALPMLGTVQQALSAASPALFELARMGRSLDDLAGARDALVRLAETSASMRPLADSVSDLHATVMALSGTITPLQGASERLGRLVERFPAGRRRPELPPD